MNTHHYTQAYRPWAERTDAMTDEDVKPTMTVNMLDKLVKGKDRDKQLIFAVGPADYIDVTGVLPNEDNVELGSEKYPAK